MGEFIVISSLNDLLTQYIRHDFTHVVVLASGCIIYDTNRFLDGIIAQINEHQGMCLSAHILHTGLWHDNVDFYTLHEQTMLMSHHAVETMYMNQLVINDKRTFKSTTWTPIQRSLQNVHDDYTPLHIEPDPQRDRISIEKIGDFGVAEKLIEFCMSRNWHIQNLNDDIRHSKQYSYHIEKPDDFKQYLFKKKPLNPQRMVQGHLEFFEKIDFSNRTWLYNSEDISHDLPKKTYDTFIGVASGFIPWGYLATYDFAPDTHVLFIDIDSKALDFQRWFIENYDPSQTMEWDQIVNMFQETNGPFQLAGDKDVTNDHWRSYRSQLNQKWPVISNFTYEFLNENMLRTNKLPSQLEGKVPMVWFSNIFRYLGTFDKSYETDDLQNFLNVLLKGSRQVAWIGSAPHENSVCKGPNSNPDTSDLFYNNVDIPPMDIPQIMQEINELERLNMFTDHRGTDHPGWSSFVIHGLGYDKTLGCEYYGYDMDEIAPYDWTPEAEQYTPTLVNYFKTHMFRKQYHRIRIMRLLPGGYISIHDDDPQKHRIQWATNFAINNPTNCEMHFWNDKFQYAGMVPWKDSDCKQIRIHHPHMVMNLSDEVRYHLIMHGKG